MKKLFLIFFTVLLVCACGGSRKQQADVNSDEDTEAEVKDSTLYGVCVEVKGSSLSMVTAMNDTLSLVVGDEDMLETTMVSGGMMKGDRLAVTAHKVDEKLWADRVINLTSLLGDWEGKDKSFTLTEDGDDWRILNGNLLLDKDTFSVYRLNADSLELENSKGIFLYKRKGYSSTEQKNDPQL